MLHAAKITRREEAGFTLIELMIVVTIIGILAAVAIPRYVTYMRSSQTAEVGNIAGQMVTAMQSYADSQSLGQAATVALFNTTTLVPGNPSTGTLAAILPQLSIPSNATFSYVVSAIAATGGPQSGDVAYCITATGTANAGVVGGQVFYSSSPIAPAGTGGTATAAAQGGWSGRVYNLPYLSGVAGLSKVTPVAGGYCTAAAGAQATQS